MRSQLASIFTAAIVGAALAVAVPAEPQSSRAQVDALMTQLAADKDPAMRARAARGLGEMNATEAIPVLVTALGDADSMVRSHAVGALARVGRGSEPVAVALAGALQDADPGVRSGAASDLVALGPVSRAAIPALEKALA